MAHMFLNPAPSESCQSTLFFDFPYKHDGREEEYPADPAYAYGVEDNYRVGLPGIEETYGMLGSPPRHQAHPRMHESPNGVWDPKEVDQTLEIDSPLCVCCTARLSGSMVQMLDRPDYKCIVKFVAHAINENAPPITLGNIERSLEPIAPAETPPYNQWYWGGVSWYIDGQQKEMIFTAHIPEVEGQLLTPQGLGLLPERVYRLLVKWEFYDDENVRLNISGFDDALDFEVIGATHTPRETQQARVGRRGRSTSR